MDYDEFQKKFINGELEVEVETINWYSYRIRIIEKEKVDHENLDAKS